MLPKFTMFTLIFAVLASQAFAGQNVVVVLDDSGSMAERMRSDRSMTKMIAAKAGLRTVLNKLPPDAKVGILCLNSGWVYPLSLVDNETITAAIDSVQQGGGTPLGKNLKIGADALLELRKKEHYGTYRLLVVTDGEAQDGNLIDKYLPDVLAKGITVDVIGVDMAENHSLATKVHTYRKADDPASLEAAVAEIFAETAPANDSDESDFEIIAAIPIEVATAALQTLSEGNDSPIGVNPPPIGEVELDDNGNVVPQKEAGGGISWGWVIGIIVIVVLILGACVAFCDS